MHGPQVCSCTIGFTCFNFPWNGSSYFTLFFNFIYLRQEWHVLWKCLCPFFALAVSASLILALFILQILRYFSRRDMRICVILWRAWQKPLTSIRTRNEIWFLLHIRSVVLCSILFAHENCFALSCLMVLRRLTFVQRPITTRLKQSTRQFLFVPGGVSFTSSR